MSRRYAFIVALLLSIIWWIGHSQDIFEFQRAYAELKKIELRDSLIQRTVPANTFQLNNTVDFSNSQDQVQISAYQGVEVHIEALRWANKWFSAVEDHGIKEVEGRNDFELSSVIFDPDLPDRGYPDLFITVGPVKDFVMNNFVKDVLNYTLPQNLAHQFSRSRPFESYYWDVSHNESGLIDKKVRMDLRLLEFPLTIRVTPAPDANRTDHIENGTRHPITGENLDRLDAEYINQRYGNISLLLKITPKQENWYLASENDQGLLEPNEAPYIGIAALENTFINFEGDPKEENEQRIGALIFKGQSLALANSPSSFGITEKKSINTQTVVSTVSEDRRVYDEVIQSKGDTYLNPKLFGQEKYALVHVQNIGTWRKGRGIFSDKREWADQIQLRFAIHTFVVGEWKVRRPDIVDYEVLKQQANVTPSIINRLLPDFGLNIFGKALSGGGIFLFLILISSIFFPPVLGIINNILQLILTFLKKISKYITTTK